MITIKDDTDEFARDPNQIKTKYMKPILRETHKNRRKRNT